MKGCAREVGLTGLRYIGSKQSLRIFVDTVPDPNQKWFMITQLPEPVRPCDTHVRRTQNFFMQQFKVHPIGCDVCVHVPMSE